MISFVCGCRSKLEIPLSVVRDAEGNVVGTRTGEMIRKHLATFDSVAFDEAGFLICAIHRARRSGWRSVPYTATTVPDGLPSDMNELEWEQYQVFGVQPARQVASEISLGSDLSWFGDNRDPSLVGSWIIDFTDKAREGGHDCSAVKAAGAVGV